MVQVVSDESPQIAVLLVDDQELVRSGLRRILRRKDGFAVVAECADGDEVPAAVAEHRPDVIVMNDYYPPVYPPGPGVTSVGHCFEPNGTGGGRNGFIPRLVLSATMAARASPPISS